MARGNYMKFRFRGRQPALGGLAPLVLCMLSMTTFTLQSATQAAGPQRRNCLGSDLIRASAGSYVRPPAKLGRAAVPPQTQVRLQ